MKKSETAMPNNDGTYKLSYDIQPGPVTRESALAEGRGACDDLVIISVIRGSDGSTSNLFLSVDGDTHDELTGRQLFNRWVTMAERLHEEEDLTNWQAALVELVRDRAKAHITIDINAK